MTARVDVPTDCSNDLDYVYQATCSAQVTYTRWSEGTENEYRYEKTTGVASYVGAFGYVGSLCNVTFDHGVGQPGPGTVEGGGRATAFCAAECAVCGTRLDGQPVCGQDDCELGPGGVYGQYSLAELCFRYGCPGTLADAESMRLGCTGTSASFVRQYTGCGVIQLESYAGFSSNRYFFDPTTKELVGAVEGTDTGRPCQGSQVSELRGGDVPAGECTDVTTCDFCTLDSGAGGTTSPSGLDVCPVN